jgi:hypothetical protein
VWRRGLRADEQKSILHRVAARSYAGASGSSHSRWIPWELGLSDSLKGGRRTVVLPAIDTAADQAEVDRLEAEVGKATERKEEFEEEQGGDEGALNGLEGKSGITKGNVQDSPSSSTVHGIAKSPFRE